VHVLIADGNVDHHNLRLLGLGEDWIKKALADKGLSAREVFFMGRDDAGKLYWIKKEEE